MRPTAADTAAARAALIRSGVQCIKPDKQLSTCLKLITSKLNDAAALVRELDAAAATPMVQATLLDAVSEVLQGDSSPQATVACQKLRRVLQRAGFAQAALRALATHVAHAYLAQKAFKALFYLNVWELEADVEEAVARETLAWACHDAAEPRDDSGRRGAADGDEEADLYSAVFAATNVFASLSRSGGRGAAFCFSAAVECDAARVLTRLIALGSSNGAPEKMMHSWLITLALVVGQAALSEVTLPVALSLIVDAVLSAMGRFLHSHDIQSMSIKALVLACSRSEPVCTHAARAGASAALAAALAHHGPEVLQKEMASIASRIQHFIRKAPPSVAAATLRHVVTILRKHTSQDGAYQSLRFLRELAHHDFPTELVPLFLSENALALTMDAMRAHPRVMEIQFNGCYVLLGVLRIHDAHVIDVAVEAGALNAAVQGLRHSNLVAAGRMEMPDDFAALDSRRRGLSRTPYSSGGPCFHMTQRSGRSGWCARCMLARCLNCTSRLLPRTPPPRSVML